MEHLWIWLGIAACVSQSAMLSGLNLAVFSLSRLRLEVAARAGDQDAARVLLLRSNANWTLATILWANVAVNVALTLLADSVLAGIAAFLFSTVVITFLGEIFPQAYFSRHALRIAAFLSPLVRMYRWLLWPVARPVGLLLDLVVGREAIPWFGEDELRRVIAHHVRSGSTEMSAVEAIGAINFLALDDLPIGLEGEPLDPKSVLSLPFENGLPRFPEFQMTPDDPWVRRVAASGKKWIVITDASGEPRFVMNAPDFFRLGLFEAGKADPMQLCHRPLVVRDASQPLGQVLTRLTVHSEHPGDDVIDEDLVLLWTDGERRILTGSDILGRLFRHIARAVQARPAREHHRSRTYGPGRTAK